MRVDEVVEKVDAGIDVKTCIWLIVYIHYIATGFIFIPCPNELQPDTTRTLIPYWTEFVYKTDSNIYGNY